MLLAAVALAALASQGSGRAFLQSSPNPRWEFLRDNLSVFPGMEGVFESDVRLFWRLRPNLRNVRCREKLPDREYVFSVSTDEQGRRFMPKVDKYQHSVLFLGDSCTFGVPVNDNETFPALVQQKLGRRDVGPVQCVNAGVPGYSAFQGRIQLEQLDESWTPDAVVITFWLNGRTSWDHLSDAEHEELLAAERAGEFSRHRLTRLLRRAIPEARPRLTEEEFAEQIRLMLRWCRQRGSSAVLQVWPVRRQFREEGEIDRQRILRRIGREEEVPVVDLAPIFRARKDTNLFADEVHASKVGYEVVANALTAVLLEVLSQASAHSGEEVSTR